MSKKPLVLIFLGKQGSGKGTQAELVGEKLELEYVGTGDLYRKRKKDNDFTGQKVTKIVDTGGLAPTVVSFSLWWEKWEEIKKNKKLKGFIIDGSPRKMIEVHLIDEALKWFEWDENLKIILIDISTKEAIWRMTKRRMCAKCREIIPFVGEFKKMTKCPECGGKLVKRADDTVQGAKNRLSWFKTEVQPVINFYKKQGRLILINGEQPIEKVFKDILKVIK